MNHIVMLENDINSETFIIIAVLKITYWFR